MPFDWVDEKVRRDAEGNAQGWRCDPCADAVEQGRDCW